MIIQITNKSLPVDKSWTRNLNQLLIFKEDAPTDLYQI